MPPQHQLEDLAPAPATATAPTSTPGNISKKTVSKMGKTPQPSIKAQLEDPAPDPSPIPNNISNRVKVLECLRTFNKWYFHSVQEEKSCSPQEKGNKKKSATKSSKVKVKDDEDVKRPSKRPDLKAITVMRDLKATINSTKTIGPIPGIDVGHQFLSRAEMVVVGLHHHWLNGIDYIGKGKNLGFKISPLCQLSKKISSFPITVAIVVSGQYEDYKCEEIIYTGQGGNDLLGKKQQIKDQKLDRGNLGLKNCEEQSVPVRVIRGHKCQNSYTGKVYTYDGLYNVVGNWVEKGVSGFTIYKFRLRRCEGQPPLTTNQGEQHRISKSVRILCDMDHPFYPSGKVSTSAKRRRRGDKEEKLNVRKEQRRIPLSLPDELLEEILCRMSVRALTQFKCVSKSWCDRISSEEFINLHMKKYQASVILVNSVSTSPPYEGCSIFPVYPPSTPRKATSSVDFTVPIYVNNQVPGYVPSTNLTTACNGIICISASGIPDKIALWNPATKNHKIIPESKLPRQFNLTYSRVMFGYDDVTNDYKIIQVLCGRANAVQLELYSINSGLWKKLDIGDIIKDPDEKFLPYFLSTGGKIVSMIVLHGKETVVERRWKVVLFDMSTEKFEIVQVPIEAAVFNELGLTTYEGSIGLMDEVSRDQMWVLNDINSPPGPGGGFTSWRKVNMPMLLEQYKWQLLAVWDDSMLLSDFFSSELFMFDRGRQRLNYLGSSQYWVYTGIRYKESLVRLF